MSRTEYPPTDVAYIYAAFLKHLLQQVHKVLKEGLA